MILKKEIILLCKVLLITNLAWSAQFQQANDSSRQRFLLRTELLRQKLILSRRIDSIFKDSSIKDTIPDYIVITDTVKTYPLTKDSLEKISIKGLKRPFHALLLLKPPEISGNYCLIKPKYWSKSFDLTLNLTEATFSQNWKAGGLNSLAALGTINAKTDYERYDVSFTNELQSQYGLAEQKTQGLRKTADRLYLDSKFAIKIKNPFYLFTALNFQSQFASGYSYSTSATGNTLRSKLSGFLAPGYLTESLGLEYKPDNSLSLRFGFGSFRQTFVVDTTIYKNVSGNYGVAVGERTSTQAAFQFVANFDKNIAKNLHLKTLFQFFESYSSSTNTSSRLDISLTAKINKMLDLNFMESALYDRSQDSKIQFTQFLSLGIAYKYSDF